ncbi:unnamed protein product [Rotaria sordida]|uniref:Uncharacterized protein n=1 Tax=Rotaria sordida TaxID=392033 RepID=A0A815TCS2_9BILA|nr:unnamed protein product [Rotaria sordida]CAF1220338.1 unnamed protein product [Rotaria sordida]CAF1309951.1 unnamed protein product [Rotaria sordida]CAF1498687.1 unnamed protein product [Rotaria sordida]CAF1500236.1 unnamed protein product [Rotaria sordida]
MNNHTKSILPFGLFISMGHLTSIFSLLCILILILIILFLIFIKQKDNYISDEHELPSDMSTNINERKSLEFHRSKKYSSTSNNQQYPSISSFQIEIDEHNIRSTTNLLSSK